MEKERGRRENERIGRERDEWNEGNEKERRGRMQGKRWAGKRFGMESGKRKKGGK